MEGHFGKEAQILYYLKSAPGAANRGKGAPRGIWPKSPAVGGRPEIINNNNNGRGRSARKSVDSQHSSPRCSPAQLRGPLYLKVFRELVRERGPKYIRKAKQAS